MLTLVASQEESLWDVTLPVEVRELPEDLAALDRLLADPELLAPIAERAASTSPSPLREHRQDDARTQGRYSGRARA